MILSALEEANGMDDDHDDDDDDANNDERDGEEEQKADTPMGLRAGSL